ncbi:MAG: conserved membrane protein of unknown function [Nitrosopumilales archaeon]|nr:MAG: conserved membrane protein of unknown function [Nitrosopumilales archaeon]
MDFSNKALQALGIPYSALISIIFGMMVLSLPIGAYVMFNSDVGDEINFEYPISGLDFFSDEISFEFLDYFEIGDIFIIMWIIFVILFSISIMGPKKNFLETLVSIMTQGKHLLQPNYLVTAIKWFSILILISGIINLIQQGFDITIEPPSFENELTLFFYVSVSPLIEELEFRVLLIGVPLYLMYSRKASFQHFFKCLWNPSNLDVNETKKAIILIIVVGVFFGAAHIFSGETWSSGKLAQAAASGIIIGWVYFRSGLVPAILIHWATNYFIFSYVYLVADINMISVQEAFSHSLIMTFEILFVSLAVISIAIMIVRNHYFKREEKLEV